MMKKIGILLLIISCILCITGCNNETEEERLQRRVDELTQQSIEAANRYNDARKATEDYYRYRNAIENAK